MSEDDDFSQRVARSGYHIITAEDCLIHHFGHGSFSKLEPAESTRIFDLNRKTLEAKWGAWKLHSTHTTSAARFSASIHEAGTG